MKLIYLFISLLISTTACTDNQFAPADQYKIIYAQLAQRVVPDEEGAMGRNRAAYFHVRFQFGLHHFTNYGIATKNVTALKYFFSAAEYAFRYQLEDGVFLIKVPDNLKNTGNPSPTDLASGVAFFMYSLGAAIMSLESSDWFLKSSECSGLRERLAVLKKKLGVSLNYLYKHRALLMRADKYAPNRLLFNALAFYTIGKISDDENALDVASEFVNSTIRLVHEDGYFIEAGGFDSSYNGVATALCFHLLLLNYKHEDKHGELDQIRLEAICQNAIAWQLSRITDEGKILSIGNSRVKPNGQGESFLGRTKDVDVAHTIEALILAYRYMHENIYLEKALKVLAYYKNNR